MLYIGANHLGNIKDTPLRVIELLKNVNYVIIEFEEIFLGDIKRLNIPVPNYLIYKNDSDFLNLVIKLLEEEKSILLLNEMGYPGIADPGCNIVSVAIEKNIPINIIPGPSIGPAAIAASGFSSPGNILIETFDKTFDQVVKIISEFKNLNYPIVVLDYKENMLNIIKLAQQHLPNREVCLCINLGWDFGQKIIKKNYEEMINFIEGSTHKDLFGLLHIRDGIFYKSVTTLVFGPLI